MIFHRKEKPIIEFKKGESVGLLYSKNRLYYLKIKSWLYDSFALTSLGIFKFKFEGYMKGAKVYSTYAILPQPIYYSGGGNK